MTSSESGVRNSEWPAEPAAAAIFGIPFHDTTLAETLDRIDVIVQERKPRYLVTPNLDFAAQAAEDPDLHRIILGADRVLCDGMPLVWASRILGAPLGRRVAGSDLVPLIAERAAAKGHKLYFLGSTREIIAGAREILCGRHPRLSVVGLDSPPHAPLEKMNHAEISARIRAAGPDILLVALGCPKQEKWIAAHYRQLGVPCSIGIGASLDFIAGKTRRAPRWMQRTGTEWIYRLMQEPGRLLRRYAWDFCFLVGALARHMAAGGEKICPAGELVRPAAWSLAESRNGLAADLSRVPSLDPWQFGALLRLYYAAGSTGMEFVLLNPEPAVRTLLKISGVDRIIPIQEAAR